MKSVRIGVLSLQGGFIEHVNIIKKLEMCEVVTIKKVEHLEHCDGLIIPGGESTAIIRLLDSDIKLLDAIKDFIKSKPTWGTCAGLVLLAKEVQASTKSYPLSILDVRIMRNAFGSQVNSFESVINIYLDDYTINNYNAVFIRAPIILDILDVANVEIVAEIKHTLPDSIEDELAINGVKRRIVAIRQNNIFATSFHPELSEDYRIHKYFIQSVLKFYNKF